MADGKTRKRARTVVSRQLRLINLPLAILYEVFVKLPISSIMQLKFVSSTMYNLLSHRDFVADYAKKSPFVALWLSKYTPSPRTRYPLMELVLLEFSDNLDQFTETTFKPKLPGWSKSNSNLMLLHVCDGLLCFSLIKPKYEIAYICNPIMGDCIKLPEHRVKSTDNCTVEYGFGFCSSVNNYKVLRIVTKKMMLPMRGHGEVFTLGVDKRWRALPDSIIPAPLLYANLVTVNEVFYWLVTDYGSDSWLFTFDLREEKFYLMPPPPGLLLDYDTMNVTSLNNQLCIVDASDPGEIVVWRMMEYGDVASWTKDLVVEVPLTLGLDALVPVTIMRNGYLLFCYPLEKYIISYNPIKRTFKRVEVPCQGSMVYTPSLLPLQL